MIEEWDRCKGYLEPALDGTHTLEDVYDDLCANRAQLWPFPNGAVVTQVHDTPQLRVLRIWLAGGRLDEFRGHFAFLEEIAHEWKCDRIEIDGRAGWGRVMDGFERKRVVYTKDVDNGL